MDPRTGETIDTLTRGYHSFCRRERKSDVYAFLWRYENAIDFGLITPFDPNFAEVAPYTDDKTGHVRPEFKPIPLLQRNRVRIYLYSVAWCTNQRLDSRRKEVESSDKTEETCACHH